MKIIPDGCGGFLSLKEIVEVVNSRPYYNIKEDDLKRLIEDDTDLPIAGIKISILGTEYTVIKGKDGLPDGYDGECDDSIKRIRVNDFSDCRGDIGKKADLDVQLKKNIRHEITHAFLFESGLAENSDWAQNEELVDWIAIQGPKIYKAWQEAGAL